MKELLSNEYVVIVAVILAPFAFATFNALFEKFLNFLRRKSPAYIQAIVEEIAERGAIYAEQVAKTTMIKREDKMMLAVDMALRYAERRFHVTIPREWVVEAIEVFLGNLTMFTEEFVNDL